jgi:hypothetical protein
MRENQIKIRIRCRRTMAAGCGLFRDIEREQSRAEVSYRAGFDAATVDRVLQLVRINWWKRQQIPLWTKIIAACIPVARAALSTSTIPRDIGGYLTSWEPVRCNAQQRGRLFHKLLPLQRTG